MACRPYTLHNATQSAIFVFLYYRRVVFCSRRVRESESEKPIIFEKERKKKGKPGDTRRLTEKQLTLLSLLHFFSRLALCNIYVYNTFPTYLLQPIQLNRDGHRGSHTEFIKMREKVKGVHVLSNYRKRESLIF